MNRLALGILMLALVPALVRADVVADSVRVMTEIEALPETDQLPALEEKVADALWREPRLALALARRALHLAREAGDRRGVYQAHHDIGLAHYFRGEYREALRHQESALVEAQALESKDRIARTLINIGVLYYVWGEHDEALDHYLRSLTLTFEMGDTDLTAICYNNVAGVHHTADRYDDALDYYRRALELYRSGGDLRGVATALNNIGTVLLDQEGWDEAMVVLVEALEIARDTEDPLREALALTQMGQARVGQGRIDEGLELYSRSLEIRRRMGDRQGIAVTLKLEGTALYSTGRGSEGIPMMEEALAIVRELDVPELIRDNLLALSEAWEAEGDPDKALEYYKAYKEAHDRIFDTERARQIVAAEARFEVDLKDREIAALKQEAEFQEFRRNIMLAGAALSFAVMALLWSRYRFQKRAHAEIRTKNEALGRAHSDLEKAAREELAHVSRVATMGELTAAFAHELHQPLAAIKANARAARNILGQERPDTAEVGEALVDIRDDAERAREIISRLREMMQKGEERREVHRLDEVLRSGVRFIEPAVRQQGSEIKLDVAGGLPPVRCDHIQLQQVVVNLVQNALSAMADDGGDIHIDAEPVGEDRVAVRVRDDGPPVSREIVANMFDPFFTTREEGLGMGLPICRTIIEAHGGTIRPVRNETGGLTMEVELPVPPPVKE